MELNEVIQKKRLIDITLFSKDEQCIIYTGICLFANTEIWMIANFSWDTNKFDGYTVFYNKHIDYYEVYKKKYIQFIEEENLPMLNLDFNKMKDMKTAILHASKFNLLAFFTEKTNDEFYLGSVLKLNNDEVTLDSISPVDFKKKKITIQLSKLFYFGFNSSYEIGIQQKLELFNLPQNS